MNATLHPFSLQLMDPLQTAEGPIDRREGFLLEWSADSVTGLGEASPLPGWTEPFRTTELTLTTARTHLTNGDLTAARSAVEDHPAARHAVDLVILDQRSRRSGRKLHRFLGGPPDPDPIPVNATIGDGTIQETQQAATAAVRAGFPCVKIKVGARDLATDISRITTVTNSLPDHILVRVDANGAWTLEEATTFADEVGTDPLQYIEQPLDPDDITGHATLREHGVPVAVDETLRDHDLQTILDAGAADAVVLKPMAIGGIERARDLALTARDAGVDPVLSTTVDGAIARTAAAHIAASLPDPLPAGLATGNRFTEDLVPNMPPIVDGHLHLPEDNGNGIALTSADDA